jgi:hypothetical protein
MQLTESSGRAMKKLLSVGVALAALTISWSASAQEPTVKPEIRPFMGINIPMGDQKDLFDDAVMYGLQAGFEVKPTFHLLGSFAWVPVQSKFPGAQHDAWIVQYDVGMEFNLDTELSATWSLKPFLGFGGGARSYFYEGDVLNDRTCTSGYGTLGTELAMGRTAIRLEGRGNVFCFKSPLPDPEKKTRGDVGLTLGLAYHFK